MLPLYQRVLGEVWDGLPAPLRAVHDVTDRLTVAGEADIDRGTGPVAALVATVFGFPPAGQAVPVRVCFTVRDGVEHWQRDFNGRRFHSWQFADRLPGQVCERFGPFVFVMALVWADGRLNLVVKRWTCLGLPMPRRLAPGGEAHERVEDGCFRFHVEIGLPGIGRVVRYRGWLMPVAA